MIQISVVKFIGFFFFTPRFTACKSEPAWSHRLRFSGQIRPGTTPSPILRPDLTSFSLRFCRIETLSVVYSTGASRTASKHPPAGHRRHRRVRNMEKTRVDSPSNGEDEEYVLLDLGDVSLLDIPPNAPFVLSDLDTMNPLLTICDKIKLVGEYEETIGTCLTFGEEEVPMVEEEARLSKTNRPAAETAEPKPAPRKELKPIAAVHKILKFKLLLDSSVPNSTT